MKKLWIVLSAALFLCLYSCEKPPLNNTDPEPEPEPTVTPVDPAAQELEKTYKYVNIFASNYMDLYYLWNKEIASGLKSWKETDDPIEKVRKIRYKDSKGDDIDRWTMVTDDYEGFFGSISGTQKTYGFDWVPAWYTKTTICAVVTYTYADSPAKKAGLKRGDLIVTVNGREMTEQSYSSVYPALISGDTVTVGLSDGSTKTITAKTMYEDPVLLSKVFDCGDKKVGYLVYTSFTLDSCKDLVEVCKSFKAAGVSELILDLRYNGGGFVTTEQVLASMLAPEAEVLAGSVLSTEVYNADLTTYYKQSDVDTNTYFSTKFNLGSKDNPDWLSTEGANIGLDKLYAIVDSGTASASEAILCDLYPYMDITLVGGQTHGKFCSGIPLEGEEFYIDFADVLTEQMGASSVVAGKKYAKNWGLYVMISRFADKNGETRCMPDGLTPDVEVEDEPWDGVQLGNPKETMLAEALKLCGYKATAPATRRNVPALQLDERLETAPHRPDFGLRILMPEQLPNRKDR